MSVTEVLPTSPTPTIMSKLIPHVLDTESIMDIEITDPLTLSGNSPVRSRSSSPSKDKMSFNSARERNERMSSRRPSMGNRGGNSQQGWGEEAISSPSRQLEYNSSASMIQGGYGQGGYADQGGYASQGGQPHGNTDMMGEECVPLRNVRPGDVWPSNNQLDVAFGYGIRRPDGSITRLIPADERASGHVNPNIQPYQSAEGLIILPPPRQNSPQRRYGPEIMVPYYVSPTSILT